MQYKKEQFTDSSDLKKSLGSGLYRKLICSILKIQFEISNNFNIPIGNDFILFAGDTLIWSLTGENITKEERQYFNELKSKDEIKEYAIKSLSRNKILSTLDLKKIEIIKSDDATIEIYLKDRKKEIAKSKTLWQKIMTFFGLDK